ncbi:hypothetical protein HMPREF0591_1684 [Mycobacterium parascrofulaceum ATCC BAA-614]|uniref:Uncharacterized protein n=1 Tax=Mycobacterium parascrofulaceum ATCC BAA-614 TaxID=525368 RepID=D5P690_9MYCO|nr:hypothetical protein HMPREF0591_1684 [Mycobacterium parascrofulaceum ATCC BAA-614]
MARVRDATQLKKGTARSRGDPCEDFASWEVRSRIFVDGCQGEG